ncbi:hypothetical protein D3C78_1932060 [compost metagenome]
MPQIVLGGPAEVVGSEVLPVVGRLARVNGQVIHRAREAADVHRREISLNTALGGDQHLP